MAEEKKSILVYADWEATFDQLSDEEAGKLIKHFFKYVNDKNPEIEDRILKIAFEPIKQQLKRDLKKWGVSKKEKSDSGRLGNLKRWNQDLFNQVINEDMTIDDAENIAKDRKAIKCIANVANVAVDVTVDVDVIKKEKEKSFPVMPKSEDVGELPEVKVESAIQLMKITQQTDVTKKQVATLWNVFKIQNLTGKKYYADLESVQSHFINWIKTQRIEKNIRVPGKFNEPANIDYMLKKLN